MASLTGQTIQSTYDALLKISGNDALTSSLQRITDGLGNFSPLYLSTTAVEISSGLNVVGSITGSNLSGTNTGDETNSTIKSKLGAATSSNDGYLTATDWSTFNAKQNALTNPITGTGTTTYLPKFTGSTTLGNSQISDDGTEVYVFNNFGMGGYFTTTVKAANGVNIDDGFSLVFKTDVSGVLNNIGEIRVDNNSLTFGTGNGSVTEKMRLNLSGNLGIGTTTPSQRLHVIGNGLFSGDITAGSFIRSGGTSSQFLKADGSVDSNTYALQSALSGYLPLTGGNINGSVGITNSGLSIPLTVSSSSGIVTSITGTSSGGNVLSVEASGGTAGLIFNNSSTNHTLDVLANGASPIARFRNSSSTILAITNNSVGIGTSSPSFRLTTNFSAPTSFTNAAGDFVQMWQASGTNGLGVAMSTGDSVARLVTNNGYQLAIAAGGTETARFTSSGNVGIGTTTPTSRLSVWEGEINISNLSSGFTTPMAGVSAFNNDASNGGLILKTATSNSLTEKVRITSAGNIGIGTSSPQVRLHSYGAALTVNDEGTYSARFSNNSNKGVVIGYDTTNNKGHIGSINPAVAWTDLILNANGGNVGIGTTSPDKRLHVSGSDTVLRIQSGTGGVYMQMDSGASSSYIGQLGTSMYFENGGSERMRITSGGAVFINKTSFSVNEGALRVAGLSGNFAAAQFYMDGTGFNNNVIFTNDNGQVGSISTSGTSTSYNTSSDYRLKQDLKEYNGLSLINSINTYDFEWKSDKSRNYGVLAHELQEVVPYAVTGEKDGEEMQGVDYSKLVPILVKAIQEQQAQIEELKAKLK